jgi:uncharacterized damage-inducible protein DinB
MPTVADVRRTYRYNQAVYEAFLRKLERLPWGTTTTDLGSGHRSMKDTMVHILNVHDAWLNYIAPGRVRDLRTATGRRPEELKTWADVRGYRDRVWGSVDPMLAGLTSRALGRRVKAPWMPGRYTLADAFQQATLEQAHHLGEIIALLWQLEIEPPEMTWIDTTRELEKRSARPHRTTKTRASSRRR